MSQRRIALGTAQFGQRYGIANRAGAPEQHEIEAILRCAQSSGCDTIDTAMAYGDSEVVLGRANAAAFNIVTKLPPLEDDCDVESWVRTRVLRSLERLRVKRLHGLLLHRPADLTGPRAPELQQSLLRLKAEGLVGKLGVSVYQPAELPALQRAMPIDLVQAPYNILDRRFEHSGCFEQLNRDGVEIHVRSVFLQGLLLFDRAAIPAAFRPWQQLLGSYHDWLAEQGSSALGACLGFALSNGHVHRVVVGTETAAQLQEIYQATETGSPVAPAGLATEDAALINPSNWKST